MPSCTRAPPESLMKTKGDPVLSDCCMISATLMECTSPAEPPDTVKSWLARCTRRPPIDAAPVTTPSAGKLFPAMPNSVARCSANSPVSSKLPASTSASTRSRAVSLPPWCCFSSRVLAAAQHGFAGALAEIGDSSPAWYEWPYMKSFLERFTCSRRYGHFVRLAVQLHVVGDGGAHRTLAVFHRRSVWPAPPAAARLRSRDPCPDSSGPCSRVVKNLRRHLGEHGVGQHVLIGAVAARQRQRGVAQFVPLRLQQVGRPPVDRRPCRSASPPVRSRAGSRGPMVSP